MDLSNGIWDKCNITEYLTMEGLGVFLKGTGTDCFIWNSMDVIYSLGSVVAKQITLQRMGDSTGDTIITSRGLKGSISFQQELVQWGNMDGLSSSQLSGQYLW